MSQEISPPKDENSSMTVQNQETDNELNEVSYSILDVKQYFADNTLEQSSYDDILQQFSTTINVRLSLEDQNFPHVPFDEFDSLSNEDKIFLYGPSGCGKSRALYEIIKNTFKNFDKIYIINPRNDIGLESGRIPLRNLISKFDRNDAVIWDNFPDDLVRRDMVNARHTLATLSSCNVKKLVIVQKPQYLELFRQLPNQILDYFPHEITYDKKQFKNIVMQYGTIPQFKEICEQYVVDNIDTISQILWKKEPSPLTVFDYYNELSNKHEVSESSSIIDGVTEAKELLRSTVYYERQFALISDSDEGKNSAEFLYTLSLCYEIGLERTESKISHLQKSIFGSVPPTNVTKSLSSWAYLSGSHYSIHDVCRKAIKLSDFVKTKMLPYICDNFNEIITNNSHQINLLGLFIGKNVQFLPQSSEVFLHENVYGAMKKNAALAIAIGQGAGEVFPNLEDDIRKLLLTKADTEPEFGVGMAESLGNSYPSFDFEQRKIMLQKIYDGFLFARFFGQSLGRHIIHLSTNIRNEIFDHTNINPQFADGIGIGLQQIFDSLDDELKKQLLEGAEENIDLTRGIGFGLAYKFDSLSEEQRQEIYVRTGKDFQLDLGLAFSLALQYPGLPKIIQESIFRRCKNYNGFDFGFGLYLAYATLDKCPDEVLSNLDNDGDLSFGLGFGWGVVYPYLSTEFQSFLASKTNNNGRLDRGLGFGLGIIFQHLPEEFQNNFFGLANTKNQFDLGLGNGIGFAWIYQTPKDKEKAYARCTTNSDFAYGLGFGQGYHFKYVPKDEQDDIFKNALNSNQYDIGLGYGLGWAFPYLGDELRKQVLQRTTTNNVFSYGLGIGLGQLYIYHSSQVKTEIFEKAATDGWFARGLGIGIGCYSLALLSEESQNEILLRMDDDEELAIGLGEGIGNAFQFFEEKFQKKILNETIWNNSFFTKGLGIGFGKNFSYLPKNLQEETYKRAEENIDFAIGLGEGVGIIFQYLGDSLRNTVTSFLTKESGFAKGLGIGLGSTFIYYPKEFQNELLFQRSMENSQFAIGLGNGLGSIIEHISEFQSDLFKLTEENPNFAMGLGEGIGKIIFKYLDNQIQEEILDKIEENANFAKGIGCGMGGFYRYYDSDDTLYDKVTSMFSLNPSLAEGYGTGTGIIFPYLSENLQEKLFQLAEQNPHFARAFGFSLGHVFHSISQHNDKDASDYNTQLIQNSEFGYGFGVGVGHNFPYLNSEIQGEMITTAKKTNEFGGGVGIGLSKSFRYLDKILEQEVLKHATNEEKSEFSYGLGYGLGCVFPSAYQQLKAQLLEFAKNNTQFTKGLGYGINQSCKYLDKDTLEQLSKIAQQNDFFNFDSPTDGSQFIDASLKNDFSYDYFSSVGLTSSNISMDGSSTLQSAIPNNEEISFIGQHKKCCVCFIDMMSSTKISSQLDKMHLSKYYSIFLNSISTIINNFDGKIIKNAGDCLIYYFPNTVDAENDPSKFNDVLESGITMTAAHQIMNAIMQEENLPPINYRISADYGRVEIAQSQSSQSEDLFGSTMNVCSKINHSALPNGMIIGDEMYKIIKSLDGENYKLESAGTIDLGLAGMSEYHMYNVKNNGKTILNPFKHTKSTKR